MTFGSNMGRPLTAIGYQWTLILNGCCERVAYKFVFTGKLVSREGYSARQLTHQTSIVDFNHDDLPRQSGKRNIGKGRGEKDIWRLQVPCISFFGRCRSILTGCTSLSPCFRDFRDGINPTTQAHATSLPRGPFPPWLLFGHSVFPTIISQGFPIVQFACPQLHSPGD